MKLLGVLICLMFCTTSFAQKKEKNSQLLNADTTSFNQIEYKDSVKIKNYLNFIFDNFRSDLGNTINICKYLFNRSADIKNLALMANALNIQGSIYALKNDFLNATQQYISAANIFEKISEPNSSAIIHNNLGLIFNNSGNKRNALQYFQKGLEICDKYNLHKTRGLINNNLANLYITEGNLNLGLKHAITADSLFSVYKMNTENAVSSNLIGAVYFYLNDYKKATDFYERSYDISSKTNDLHSQHMALNNISEIYAIQKNSKVLSTLLLAENYFKSINDYVNLQQVYINYNIYFKNINDLPNQVKYLEKLRLTDAAIFDSTQKKSLLFYQTKFETQQKENKILLLSQTDSIKNLQIIAQQFAINKNLFQLSEQQLALSYANLQLAEDSLKLLTQNETILQNKLDASAKQARINTLSKEALQQKISLQEKQLAINQKNTTIGIIAAVASIILLVGYGFYRKKQLQQQALFATEQAKQRELLTKAVIEAEEAERKRIASDLHDGVGQLFSAVKMNLNGLLDRIEIPKEADKFLAEKTLALVDESCKEVRVISHKMMPNFLLKSGIAADIRSFIEKIDEHTLKINFETKGFKEQLEFNEEVILYRVIQELINNVIKHAEANELFLQLERTDKNIKVMVADNGKGFNYEAAKAKGGLGLKNILVRIEYLKGSINFIPNTPTGTSVNIFIPIA